MKSGTYIRTPEIREKLRLIHLGKKKSLEAREHMRLGQLGRKQSEATKEKLRRMRMGSNNPFFGKTHSDEIKRRMSILRKGIPRSAETIKKLSECKRGEKSYNWKGGVSKNREYQRQHRRNYYRTSPVIRRLNQKRQFMQKNGGELTVQTIQKVYEDNIKIYGTLTCYLCLQPIPFGKDHLEHKIPLSRGGTNARENLDIACQRCNLIKGTKTVEEFMLIKK